MAGWPADYATFRSETDRLLALLGSTGTLAPAHQKVIAEVVLLRLAILIENGTKVAFCRIACGSTYLDGSAPLLVSGPYASSPAAVSAMRLLNRPRPRSLPWNDGAEVRENVRHIVDGADPCYQTMINFAAFLTEVRYIRNHIAHKNDGTRRNYKKVTSRYYGANVRGVTCGTLLLSSRVSVPPLVEKLIRQARVYMRVLTKG